MSACLILQTPQSIFMGADSAISTTIKDQIYRLNIEGIKLWQVDDKVIFCSGEMDIAYKIILNYMESDDSSIENLRFIIEEMCGNDALKRISVIVSVVNEKGSIVYEISPESGFKISTSEMYIDQDNGVKVLSAGIKTRESVKAAEACLQHNSSVQDTYRQVFNSISYEGVGGFLFVKQITFAGIRDLMHETITEKSEIRILTEALYHKLLQAQLIVGERVFGKLIAGSNLTIDASDSKGTKTFTVDGNGVTISGSALTITGGLSPNQLDPSFKDSLVNLSTAYNGVVIDTVNGLVITKSDNSIRTKLNATEGFKFQKMVNGSWVDKLYYDSVSGNLVIDGEINARALKVQGVNVLTADSKISVTAIESLEVGKNVTFGAKAYINWNNVTNQPFIPTSATQIGAIPSTYIDSQGIWTGKINANSIVAGTISADKISGGTISGVNIDVEENCTVGNILFIGNGTTYREEKKLFLKAIPIFLPIEMKHQE